MHRFFVLVCCRLNTQLLLQTCRHVKCSISPECWWPSRATSLSMPGTPDLCRSMTYTGSPSGCNKRSSHFGKSSNSAKVRWEAVGGLMVYGWQGTCSVQGGLEPDKGCDHVCSPPQNPSAHLAAAPAGRWRYLRDEGDFVRPPAAAEQQMGRIRLHVDPMLAKGQSKGFLKRF